MKYLSHVHRVTVFTVHPYKQQFDIGSAKFKLIFAMPFKFWRYINPANFFRIIKLAKREKADWLFFDQPWMGWILILIKFFTSIRIFIRSNNIEYIRFKSMGKWYWPILNVYEKWTYRAADLVIFVSEEDRQRAISLMGLKEHKTMLSPYGIDVEQQPAITESRQIQLFKESLALSPDAHLLLFFATLSYSPNAEAVQFILDEIYPRLTNKMSHTQWHIVICGKGLNEVLVERINRLEHITYKGFVADIHTCIDAADLMLNPILSGGGVKTKAIDTLARGQRVVSTVTGAEGIDRTVCGNCLVVVPDNDWDAYVDAIIESMSLPKQMPEAFKQVYEWPGIIDLLTAKLQSYSADV